MTVSVKRVALAAGLVLGLGGVSMDAEAAIAYAGRGTQATSTNAVAKWISDVGGLPFYTETFSNGITGGSPGSIPLPRGPVTATGMASPAPTQIAQTAMTGTNQGTIGGAGTSNTLAVPTGKGIRLNGFSATVTSFGFYLQNLVTNTLASPITITLTDNSNVVTTISVLTQSTGGTDAVTFGGAGLTGSKLTTGTPGGDVYRLSGTSEFFGFTGITDGIKQIDIGNAAGTDGLSNVRPEIGDFFQATPEPASMALLGAGLAGLGLLRRRRKTA